MNNSSQRVVMLALLLTVVGAVGLFTFFRMFWTPWSEAASRRNVLEEEVEREQKKHNIAKAEKAAVAKWNALSLPKDFDRAAAEYGKMLKPLLRDCGLTVEDFKGPPPQEPSTFGQQKKPKHVVLTFSVRAKGSVESLVKTLEKLQRMPVMHRVATLVVDRADAKDRVGKLNVNMTIEAVIVAGSNNQPKLDALGPASTTRKYSDIALRNPFVGYLPPPPPPPPPKEVAKEKEKEPEVEPPPTLDVRDFIRLDTITLGDGAGSPSPEAFLINMAQRTPPTRLRSAPMSGYDTFRIMDEERTKTILKAKVLRIDQRDVYFQVGEEVFAIHFNQTLADALRRPLNDTQLEKLELKIDPDFASGEKKGKATKKGR